jgi:hypothetical protein
MLARIILLTAAGLGTVEITRRTGKSKNCVWRWQERFMQKGIAGLLRDKTWPSRIPPLCQAVIDRVVAPPDMLLPAVPAGDDRLQAGTIGGA